MNTFKIAFLGLLLLSCSGAKEMIHASTLFDDYAKLRLVCFWKVVSSQKEAISPHFPAANRMETPYQKQALMGHPDISASFFVNVAPGARLMANSLLEGAEDDTALITTRVDLEKGGQGDNYPMRRNTSGQNYIHLNSDQAGRPPIFLSYSCGVYEIPTPFKPTIAPGFTPRLPPIH